MDSKTLIHGSRSTFVNHSCRCHDCVEADRSYHQQYRERNRESKKRYLVEWRKRNPQYDRERYRLDTDRYKSKNHRYTARKKNADCGCVTPETLARLRGAYDNRCAYCGGPYQHLDHFEPLSRNGLHCISNLRPSCSNCNFSKGAQSPETWLDGRYNDFEIGLVICGE